MKRKASNPPEGPKPVPDRSVSRAQAISAADFIPEEQSLPGLRDAARKCRGCDLWEIGTQTVFGEGKPGARIMMVGEQPGDREDLAGRPFVGPAGTILDKALKAAGIDRDEVYVTNVVKHFNWIRQGKRRIHKKPSSRQIAACRPWLDAELRTVRPRIVVCLGATAAQALLGNHFRVTQQRGTIIHSNGLLYTATVHPSSILRAQDDESRHREMELFVRDMKKIAVALDVGRAA